MGSYTAMSVQGMRAVENAYRTVTPEGYEMRLNETDFVRLIYTLKHMAETNSEEVYDKVRAEWAEGFLSGIAETLGVDFI